MSRYATLEDQILIPASFHTNVIALQAGIVSSASKELLDFESPLRAGSAVVRQQFTAMIDFDLTQGSILNLRSFAFDSILRCPAAVYTRLAGLPFMAQLFHASYGTTLHRQGSI